MKLITVWSVIAFASYTTAQSCDAVVSSVPSCAAGCINSAASVAGCKAGDYACQCSSSQSASINTLALNCVVSNCGIPTALAASSSANAVCACVTSGLASATSAPATVTSSASTSPSAKPTAAPLTTTSAPKVTATPSKASAGGSFVSGASGSFAQGPSTCVPVRAATSSPDCSQQVAKIPSCALTCFSNAISEIGCAHTDYACQCSSANMNALTSNITPCVIKSCSQEDALSVQSAADGVCKCANDWVLANPKATTCYALAGASVSISGSGSFAPGSSIPSSFYATTKAATTTKAASTTPAAATTPTPAAVSTAAAGKLSIGAGMVGAAILAVVAL